MGQIDQLYAPITRQEDVYRRLKMDQCGGRVLDEAMVLEKLERGGRLSR